MERTTGLGITVDTELTWTRTQDDGKRNESSAHNDNYIGYEDAANWIGVSHAERCMLWALCRITPRWDTAHCEPDSLVSRRPHWCCGGGEWLTGSHMVSLPPIIVKY